MTIIGYTRSSKIALDKLRSIKPNDGWSIDLQNSIGMNTPQRLLRRNVPLSEHYFRDIHYDTTSNIIVGIIIRDGDTFHCQVLIDCSNGKPPLKEKVISIPNNNNYKYEIMTDRDRLSPSSTTTTGGGRGAAAARGTKGRNNSNNNTTAAAANAVTTVVTALESLFQQSSSFWNSLSDHKKTNYIVGGCLIFICWILLKVVSSILNEFITFFLVLPVLYIYLSSTCPLNESFDPKKEVKRVLRGYHLPDNHPSKPRSGSLIEEWTTRIAASVTTELSTAISGYSIEMIPLGWGMATYTTVDIPAPLALHCEWIGIHNTWYHLRTYSTAATAQE